MAALPAEGPGEAETTTTIPAGVSGSRGMTADAAGMEEAMIPVWKEGSVLSLPREEPADAKKKTVRRPR